MPTERDMQDIKKGKYENEKPPENYTQVEAPVVAKKVEPESEPPMDDMGESMMEESNEIEIDSNALPAVKKWQVGKSYPVKLLMTGMDLAEDGKTIKGKFKIG